MVRPCCKARPDLDCAQRSGFDLDAPSLRAPRFRHADGQDAIVELRFDLLGFDLLRQRNAIRELADATCLAADHALALTLLELAADQQLVADLLDLHVAALHAR